MCIDGAALGPPVSVARLLSVWRYYCYHVGGYDYGVAFHVIHLRYFLAPRVYGSKMRRRASGRLRQLGRDVLRHAGRDVEEAADDQKSDDFHFIPTFLLGVVRPNAGPSLLL